MRLDYELIDLAQAASIKYERYWEYQRYQLGIGWGKVLSSIFSILVYVICICDMLQLYVISLIQYSTYQPGVGWTEVNIISNNITYINIILYNILSNIIYSNK